MMGSNLHIENVENLHIHFTNGISTEGLCSPFDIEPHEKEAVAVMINAMLPKLVEVAKELTTGELAKIVANAKQSEQEQE